MSPWRSRRPGERLDEPVDLGRVGGTVGVEHHHDVPGHPSEAGRESVALAAGGSASPDEPAAPARRLDGAVDRPPVDQDHLVNPG